LHFSYTPLIFHKDAYDPTHTDRQGGLIGPL
jgi:hypothetical protein